MTQGRFYEDFKIGEVIHTAGRTITESDMMTFAGFSGDFHPLHTDIEFATRSVFGRPIFYGAGAHSIAVGLWVRLGLTDDTGIAVLRTETDYRAPLFVGDTMRLILTVSDVRLTSKPSRGIVTFVSNVVNQNGRVCQEGKWVIMFKRKPE